MKIKFVFLFIFLLKISCNPTLFYVLEFSRHGARSPMYNNSDAYKWKTPFSTLTGNGMRQHFLLGRYLHEKYVKNNSFLQERYSEESIKVFSTDSDRTILSAQSQLYGLYFQKGENITKPYNETINSPPINYYNSWKKWTNNNCYLPFNFQPVPIRIIPKELDVYFNPENFCKRISTNRKNNLKSKITKSFWKYLKKSGFIKNYTKIFNITNKKELNIEKMQQVYDTLICDIFEGKPLLKNITKEFLNNFYFLNAFRQLYMVIENNVKLMGSKLFERIIKEIEEKIEKKDKKENLTFFSAHDTHVNLILVALGISKYTKKFKEFINPKNYYTHDNAPFASTIFFEIYKDFNNFYVKTIYNGESIKIKNCEEMCELKVFKNILKENIFKNWKKECRVKKKLKKISK